MLEEDMMLFFCNTDVSKIGFYKDKVEETIPQLPGKLIIKEYPTGRATISTIEAHIAKCTTMGNKPDLIIIDYVDLLSGRRKSRERKDEIDDIYTSTKGLAKQLDIPIWSVSQVNRAGAQDDIIEGDKAAGSYDKMMISDFAMSLSRKKEDKQRGTGRLHIMKNRYGMDGQSFSLLANTSTGHFEVFPYNTDLDDVEAASLKPSAKSNAYDTDVDRREKAAMFAKLKTSDGNFTFEQK